MSEIFLLQGLRQNTLVAGKTTAIRIFTDPWPITDKDVNTINARILLPDGYSLTKQWLRNEFVIIPNSSKGQSIVVEVPGKLLPTVGIYYFQVLLINPIGGIAATYTLDQVQFLPTKDLRVMVSRLWSGTPTKPGEVEAAHMAMQRLATLYPLRDGISTLDGDYSAGLRYNVNDDPMGPPNQDGHLCPLFATYLNRPPNVDSIDAGITYRFPNPGEGSGGNSGHLCPNQNLPYSVIVWGAPLATVFCQETAHSFGLEAPQSPHLDPGFDAHHSKDILDNIKVYRVPSPPDNSATVGGVYAKRCGRHPACRESTLDDRLDGSGMYGPATAFRAGVCGLYAGPYH